MAKVSAIRTGQTRPGGTAFPAPALFTTRAAGIGQGMSGSPVIDARGLAVGIHSGHTVSGQESIEYLFANALGQCGQYLLGIGK